MGVREKYGPIIESALNVAVDKYLDGAKIKAELSEKLNELVDKHLAEFKHKLKAEIIDQIDGKDDIQ